MTDTIPRAAWTRCNACQQKVENDRHEINIHKLICPHRLQLQIQDLTKRIKALEKDIENLDEQLAVDADTDPKAVAPWPDDDDDTGAVAAGEDEDLVWNRDEDDDEDTPATTSSLYTPGTGPLTS